jgi:hypothetical protein
MVPFAVLARSGCSAHANLALALTSEFAALRDDPAQRALDELAIGLLDARDGGAGDQLRAVADLAAAHLEGVTLDCAIDDLLLDRVASAARAIHCCSRSRAPKRAGAPAWPSASWPVPTAPSSPMTCWPSRSWPIPRPGGSSTCGRSAPRCRCSARTRWWRASSIASASAPSAWATSRGRYGRPSCSSRCRSNPAPASTWSPICGASAHG